jgi:hypothetical protein
MVLQLSTHESIHVGGEIFKRMGVGKLLLNNW